MGPFNPDELARFARYYGFHYDRIDPPALAQDALTAMERGLNGHASSLPMIPAYISPAPRAPAGKTVIALDAGGTNLRAALVRFDQQGKAAAEHAVKSFMPGTRGGVTKTEFFDHLAGIAGPLIEKAPDVEGIGFTFSYPMAITRGADGILLAFSKEVDAPEVIGQAIGQGLREALERRNLQAPARIALLNDTAATLLAGISAIPALGGLEGPVRSGAAPGPVIGFILGTGFNSAYPETAIPKRGFASETAPQVVVCESGAFDHRYSGFLDKEYDMSTKNPGAYTLEKAASGAYLGPLTWHILKQAVKDGVVRLKNAGAFLSMPAVQTKDVNDFMYAPLSGEGVIAGLFEPDEGDALSSFAYLISIITQRAGILSAAMVAAAVERTGWRDPFAPVRIAVEGTTYMRYKGMRKTLESYLHTILTRTTPCQYIIAPVEQASLFGAATAAAQQ
ncbi:MAG: hexokinase [Spirochaetaceae bacterium]|jgi:hexokinase|nr:hexokinase [Spirochaetaceae bacterium]